MPTVADVAQIWQLDGVSVIPIQANPTKRPAVSWSLFQQRIPSMDHWREWWGPGSEFGLALICGKVSGGLEMTEIEGRALKDSGALLSIIMVMDSGGAGPIWDALTGPNGYAEDSPSGGMHLLYRISDHPVPGNTKIASDENHVVLAETRGEGGYVIVAPTGGHCHPSGEPWRLVNGNYGHLPEITWEERNLLHACLRKALDKTPEPPTLPVVAPALGDLGTRGLHVGSTTPGDAFEAATDWSEILEPHGWRVTMRLNDGETHWVRPGKDARDGMSATTGRANDRDRLYVFSTSTVFTPEVPYTKFGAFALLNYNGDHSRAASELARRGFGERRGVVDTVDVGEWVPPHESKLYSQDDIGNGHRLADRIRGSYRYIWEEKEWYRWTGAVWSRDVDSGLTREWEAVTDEIQADDPKWAKQSRTISRLNGAAAFAKGNQLTHSAGEWAPDRNLVNVLNGVLDLKTEQLSKHDPKFLMVKSLGAQYNPQAECPRFEQFMTDALPDPEMRRYVQRALGYSLLGDADQRSIFLIYGPSGTGKSTLIDTMQLIFGDYGVTAGGGAFRSNGNAQGPTSDLHALRGRRFATTSETSETAAFDEELLKRLSGRDRLVSRGLYQEPVEWAPECVLWIATNNPPKFNSDDDAIWRRTKLIPFLTVFRGEGEVPDYARRVLAPEASGILNWLLAGLRDFLAHGLGEPEEVERLATEQRRDSDSVARFIADRQADGMLVLGTGHSINYQELYARYQQWAQQVGERGQLGTRRFHLRIASLLPEVTKVDMAGHPTWVGVGFRSTRLVTGYLFQTD